MACFQPICTVLQVEPEELHGRNEHQAVKWILWWAHRMLYVPTVWNPHSHKTATTLLPLVSTTTITGLLSSTFSRKTSPPGLGISGAASASRFQFESGPASLPGPGSLFSLNSYAADLSQFQTFCLLGLCRCCKNRGGSHYLGVVFLTFLCKSTD